MTTRISGRAEKVLQRFPRHLEAESSGKLLAITVNSIVRDQDIQSADMQRIRTAHRIWEAKQISDLFLLAGLHGISRSDMSVLYARQQKSCELLLQLKQNVAADGDALERQQLAEAFLSLFSLPTESPLKLFSEQPPDAVDFDFNNAIDRLLPEAVKACQTNVLLEGIRTRVAEIAAIHIKGNGTIRALLRGAANILDLKLGEIEHSEDRYWHAAQVHDRINLRKIAPLTEYMGIEENPKIMVERGPTPRKHAELFHYLRKGFEDAILEFRIKGIGNRTVSPMIVNRDLGHGVGFFGQVPDGQELVFTQGGRVTLGGADVTSRSYAWQGACFAQYEATLINGEQIIATHRNDFVFADKDATNVDPDSISRFAVVTPAASLDREALFPHAGASLPMPSIGIGKTGFAFFVQHAHFSARKDNTEAPPASVFSGDVFASTPVKVLEHIELVTPRFGVGFADASVFAASQQNPDQQAAGIVHLRWLERQAYKVKLLIPNRFRLFDNSNGDQVKDMLKRSLKRFRPAGIDVVVDYIEPNWLMGEALLPEENGTISAIDQIRSQTVLQPILENE